MSVSEKRGLVNGGEIEKEEITRFMSEDKPIDLKAPPSRQSPHHGQMHNNQNMIFIKILIQPQRLVFVCLVTKDHHSRNI